MSKPTNKSNAGTHETSLSRRGFFRAGAGATAGMGAALAGLFMLPNPMLAASDDLNGFGPRRKLIWVPQVAGDWEIPARVGFADFCKMVGWDYQVLGNPVYSVENHLEQLNAAIAAKPDVIVTPLEHDDLVSSFEQAIAANITMIVTERAVYSELNNLDLKFIGQDASMAKYIHGMQAAAWAQKLTHRHDGVILIGGNISSAEAYLKRTATGQAILSDNRSNGTAYIAKAFFVSASDDMTSMIEQWHAEIDQAGDALVGMVGLDRQNSIAIYHTMLERNIAPGTIAAGGFGASDEQLSAIEQGYMQWAIEPNTYMQGFMSAVTAWLQLERGISYRVSDIEPEIVLMKDVDAVRNRKAIYAAKAHGYGVDAI